MPSIKHYLVVNASPQQLYDAVTTRAGLASWWTTESTAESHVGGFNTFRFGDRYFNRMKITELQPAARVEWECVEGDPEWIGTRIVFDIAAGKSGSVLRFRHQDWREETDFLASCNYNWGLYMKSLKDYLETGAGRPFGAE